MSFERLHYVVGHIVSWLGVRLLAGDRIVWHEDIEDRLAEIGAADVPLPAVAGLLEDRGIIEPYGWPPPPAWLQPGTNPAIEGGTHRGASYLAWHRNHRTGWRINADALIQASPPVAQRDVRPICAAPLSASAIAALICPSPAAADPATQDERGEGGPTKADSSAGTADVVPTRPPMPSGADPGNDSNGKPPGWAELGDAKQAILTVLRGSPERLQNAGVAKKAGYQAGTLRHHYGDLQRWGYIDHSKDGYAITQAGAALVPREAA